MSISTNDSAEPTLSAAKELTGTPIMEAKIRTQQSPAETDKPLTDPAATLPPP